MSESHNILVVEDETSIASFVAAYLKNAGYEVRTAATAHEALSAVVSKVPALIVLDLNLPTATASSSAAASARARTYRS